MFLPEFVWKMALFLGVEKWFCQAITQLGSDTFQTTYPKMEVKHDLD